MFLSKKTIRGIAYLHLVKSVHIAGQRNPKKIVVKNYGRYDKVDPEIRNAFEDAKARKELAKKLEFELRMKELAGAQQAVSATVTPENGAAEKQESNFNKALALNYGHLMLKEIWDRELNLRYKLNYLQQHFMSKPREFVHKLLFEFVRICSFSLSWFWNKKGDHGKVLTAFVL